MENKKDLWLRLRNYRFDQLVPPHLAHHVQSVFGGPDASTHAFADKLARKLDWPVPFALHAIDEYKKFVFLGMVADFPVTPSKVIDQVWHEHLLFTAGYREFCANVLRRDFDHHPELVPIDTQTAAFRQQFEATVDLYRFEFHRDPPAEFWGTPKFSNRKEPVLAGARRRREEGAGQRSDTPLYAYFSDSGGGDGPGHSQPEFGGSPSHGDGGGGGGSWPDSTSHGSPADSSGAGHGSGHSGGGESSGADSGGSGCSSSGCGSS